MLLSLESLSKSYSKILVVDDVSLSLDHGQILALLGENGAGKSTLMKMLAGLVMPDKGTIRVNNEIVTIKTPYDAQKHKIGMLQQHFALFDGLTVMENISLGVKYKSLKSLSEKINKLTDSFSFDLALNTPVFKLSAGEKQRVEIVRTLLTSPDIFILDEPTSVLTPQEADQLFEILRTLRDNGHGIIFISHKLDEVKRLCDSASILRSGQLIANCDPREMRPENIAEMMIGSKFLNARTERMQPNQSARFIVKNLNKKSIKIERLYLRGGEIFGVAGIAGNGQDQLFDLFSGEIQPNKNAQLNFNGLEIKDLSINERRELGCVFVPEERLGHASVPNLSLLENSLLTNISHQSLTNKWFIDWDYLKGISKTIINDFNVQCSGFKQRASTLSGGNLQRFVVGRELVKNPKLLVINQPTWGVDMGAAKQIRQEIRDLAEKGCIIIVISQDLDELFELCDKLSVLNNGNLSNEKDLVEWDMGMLGLEMVKTINSNSGAD